MTDLRKASLKAGRRLFGAQREQMGHLSVQRSTA